MKSIRAVPLVKPYGLFSLLKSSKDAVSAAISILACLRNSSSVSYANCAVSITTSSGVACLLSCFEVPSLLPAEASAPA